MPRIMMSPFVHDNVDVSYAAYCNAPHAKRAGFKKPTKAQFRKLYNERHEQALSDFIAKQTAGLPVPAASKRNTRTAKGKTNTADGIGALNLDPDVLEALAEILLAGKVTTPVEDGDYAERTPRDQVPADAARNAVLWALNTENLLGEAIEAAQEQGLDYITQELGQEILSGTFGPLPATR